MGPPLVIDYWADYICPWCYLAQDRVAYLADRHGAVMRWYPFELHPEIPPEGEPAPDLRRSRDTKRWLRDELEHAGLPIVARRTWSNSRRALALSAWAEPRAEWPELHLALYRAYWAEGRDIGDPGELAAIARQAGIPAADAEEAIAEGTGLDVVAAAKENALDLGIGNTPGWRFANGVVFTGVHERSVFDRVVARQHGA